VSCLPLTSHRSPNPTHITRSNSCCKKKSEYARKLSAFNLACNRLPGCRRCRLPSLKFFECGCLHVMGKPSSTPTETAKKRSDLRHLSNHFPSNHSLLRSTAEGRKKGFAKNLICFFVDCPLPEDLLRLTYPLYRIIWLNSRAEECVGSESRMAILCSSY